jgi:hypothetical protein
MTLRDKLSIYPITEPRKEDSTVYKPIKIEGCTNEIYLHQ